MESLGGLRQKIILALIETRTLAGCGHKIQGVYRNVKDEEIILHYNNIIINKLVASNYLQFYVSIICYLYF